MVADVGVTTDKEKISSAAEIASTQAIEGTKGVTDTALAKLLTTERIFPKVVDIMGTNTTCYHFHCNVTVLELRAQQQQKRKKTPRAYR